MLLLCREVPLYMMLESFSMLSVLKQWLCKESKIKSSQIPQMVLLCKVTVIPEFGGPSSEVTGHVTRAGTAGILQGESALPSTVKYSALLFFHCDV